MPVVFPGGPAEIRTALLVASMLRIPRQRRFSSMGGPNFAEPTGPPLTAKLLKLVTDTIKAAARSDGGTKGARKPSQAVLLLPGAMVRPSILKPSGALGLAPSAALATNP